MGNGLESCVGCGCPKPQTQTNYTLISARYGWRLIGQRQPDGTKVLEWRCPECWMRHRAEESTRNAVAGGR